MRLRIPGIAPHSVPYFPEWTGRTACRTFNSLHIRGFRLLLCLALIAGSLPGAERQTSEYQVKAAFLLNFTKFIEWPPAVFPDPDSPFEICIAGDDPFGPLLDQIVEGETVNGHKLTVERIKGAVPKSCKVVFSGHPEKDAPGILTVGEGEDFLREGGMIAFVVQNRRVRFDVNLKVAAHAGLAVSSKLLNVARSVEK